MSNAIGSSRESNSSRRICHLREVSLGHVADKGHVIIFFKKSTKVIVKSALQRILCPNVCAQKCRVSFPVAQQVNLLAGSPHYPLIAERQAGKL